MKNEEGPKVSVLCMCYNHAPYIRQCLDSIVGQKTAFPFLVLVHDDASTDGSANIIRAYEKRYPKIVRGIYQKENQYSKGGFGTVQKALYNESQGEYIAFCECDDYWLDPLKLQKQYEAAKKHSAAICIHKVRRIRDTGENLGGMPTYQKSFVKESGDFIKSIFEYDNPNCFIYQASSYFISRDVLESGQPEFVRQCRVGDVPLLLWCAARGPAVYLAEEMSCYRLSSISSWNKAIRKDIERQTEIQRNMIECLELYKDYTDHAYDEQIERKIEGIELGIIVLNKRFSALRKEPFRSMRSRLPLKKRVKFWLYSYWPRLMEYYDGRKEKR